MSVKKIMSVKDMVIKTLKDNNLDALCGEDCGCRLDDLAPCGEIKGDCVFGKSCKSPDKEYDYVSRPRRIQIK